jgi:predicted DNA-binding transcriptional regulator YafY
MYLKDNRVMQASRLLSILMLLQSRGRMSAPALAHALEVSVRTILRDVDQLSAAGVPIWGDRGRSGGFQLREGWSTQLTGLTGDEAQALALAGVPSAATELGLGTAATSARLKMIAALPAPWREQADLVASRLHIDPVDWYREQETPAFLREAAQAVWEGVRIEVRYRSWRGASNKTLDPLGLVLKAGAWYLIARSEASKTQRTAPIMTLRLANIEALKATQRRFRRPTRFDLAAFWQSSVAEFEAQLHPLVAQVAASPRAQVWFANARTKATTLPESGAAAIPKGWKLYELPLESIDHGARQLMSYGSHIQVISPDTLVRQLQSELATTTALYASRQPE